MRRPRTFLTWAFLVGACAGLEAQTGPVLLDFEGAGGLNDVTGSFGTRLELSKDHVTRQGRSLKLALPVHAYPGLEAKVNVRDWRPYDELVMDLFIDGEAPQVFGLWLKSSKVTDFTQRFNFRRRLQPGANHIVIPLGLVGQPARKRLWGTIDRSDVTRMAIFFGDVKQPVTAYLDQVRLVTDRRPSAPAEVPENVPAFDGSVVFDFQTMGRIGRNTGFFVDLEVPLADGRVRKLSLSTGEHDTRRYTLTGRQLSGYRVGSAVLARAYYLDHCETLMCVREVVPESGQTKHLRYAPSDF